VAELVAEAVAADDAGFDLCLIPEHHHGPRISIVAPLTLAAAIAAVTTRIRVGPGVLVLPVHDPLHVAEQVTMVDQISSGRAMLGVGIGYQSEDFVPFGVDRRQRGRRFEDALNSLGRYLGSGDDAINPRPAQSPRPPFLVGAWSEVGIKRAAQLADGWIADPIRTVAEVAEAAARYREQSVRRPGEIVVMREAWVDGGDDAAERFASVIEPVFSYYRRHGAANLPESFHRLADDRFVIGGARACVAQAAAIAERTDADVVVLSLRHPGGPDHESVLTAIRDLGAMWRQHAEAVTQRPSPRG
jgi:alkanesulfonate monooxygenase SsuD/methylene tetrahydromethanopterin reductase-like flavin-dependent oxidoreductase (luciferase family)